MTIQKNTHGLTYFHDKYFFTMNFMYLFIDNNEKNIRYDSLSVFIGRLLIIASRL